MTCRELIDVLDRYLSGELPVFQSRTIDGHLAECPDCRAYLATYRQTTSVARVALVLSDDQFVGAIPESLVKAILQSQRGSA